MNHHDLIHVCTVVLRDETGAVLTVRKRGTTAFMLPGGKPEPGESPRQTAVRECREELGVRLDPAALRPLGVFRARAANEHGREVSSTVFTHPAVRIGEPAAEIAELRWLDLAGPEMPNDLAPLLAGQVVPALLAVDQ